MRCNRTETDHHEELSMQRVILASLAPLVALGVAASASPRDAAGLPPLSCPLPAACQALAEAPASATIPGPSLAARVSAANCFASHAMDAAAVTPDAASLRRLEASVAPSLAMLDQVIASGDPYWKLVAMDAQRDIYTGMVVRARTASSDTPAARAALEPQLAPWQQDADAKITAMADILRTNPELAQRDPVIAFVARGVEHAQVATR